MRLKVTSEGLMPFSTKVFLDDLDISASVKSLEIHLTKEVPLMSKNDAIALTEATIVLRPDAFEIDAETLLKLQAFVKKEE